MSAVEDKTSTSETQMSHEQAGLLTSPYVPKGSVEFIEEQIGYRDYRYSFLTEYELEKLIWSPVARRHSCWTMQPNNYGRKLW